MVVVRPLHEGEPQEDGENENTLLSVYLYF